MKHIDDMNSSVLLIGAQSIRDTMKEHNFIARAREAWNAMVDEYNKNAPDDD